jgi:hypothetical protein
MTDGLMMVQLVEKPMLVMKIKNTMAHYVIQSVEMGIRELVPYVGKNVMRVGLTMEHSVEKLMHVKMTKIMMELCVILNVEMVIMELVLSVGKNVTRVG